VELAPDLVGATHSEIQMDIEKLGYSLHKAKFKITEHE